MKKWIDANGSFIFLTLEENSPLFFPLQKYRLPIGQLLSPYFTTLAIGGKNLCTSNMVYSILRSIG
jgi:hypothetical protein